jgi:glycosyltransferase involved in cell wall biosynthesis
MRIAMIGQRAIPDAGGIERHVEELSTRLVASGHDVIVYCRPQSPTPLAEYRGVQLVTLWTIQHKHLATLVHALLATLDGLRRGVEVFHYHAIGPGIFAPLSRAAGRTVVTTVHALDWQKRVKWGRFARHYLRLSERVAVKLSHCTIAVSRGIAEHLRAAYRIEPVFIPNGAKSPSLEIAPAEDILQNYALRPFGYLLYVGRLVPEKGCHYLIEAFSRISASFDLVLVGAPTFSEEYAARLREMAPSRVRFVEPVPYDILSVLYRYAYACIMPSDVEGLSQALLEMMAHGRCVIASDIPANTELLQEGVEIGRLFRAGDVDDLARVLEWAIVHPHEVQRLGRNAQRFVQTRYSWDSIALATEAAYLSALDGSPIEEQYTGEAQSVEVKSEISG